MLSFYPEQALIQLEFNKVQQFLLQHCRTRMAKEMANNLRFHTRLEYVERALHQTEEFKTALGSSPIPQVFTSNLDKELQMLSLQGASLQGADMLAFQKMALAIKE